MRYMRNVLVITMNVRSGVVRSINRIVLVKISSIVIICMGFDILSNSIRKLYRDV